MPTATDPLDPGRVLGQLSRLKDGLHEAVTRENELAKTREERRVAVSREISAREHQDATKLNGRLAELEDLHRQAREQRLLVHEARRARIQNAYHSSRAALNVKMQALKDARVHAAHGALVQQRQQRQAEMAAAAEGHVAFKTLLGKDLETRAEVCKSLRRGLSSFRFLLLRDLDKRTDVPATEDSTPESLRAEALEKLEEAREATGAVSRLRLGYFPLLPLAVLFAGIQLAMSYMNHAGELRHALRGIVMSSGVLLVLWVIGLLYVRPLARRAVTALRETLSLAWAARKASSVRAADLKAKLEQTEREQSGGIGSLFGQTDAELNELTKTEVARLDQRLARIPARLERLHQRALTAIERTHEAALAAAHSDAADVSLVRSHARQEAMSATDRTSRSAIEEFAGPWRAGMVPLKAELDSLRGISLEKFPAWTPENAREWSPPDTAPAALRIGRIAVDLAAWNGGLPKAPQLEVPEPHALDVPLALGFPHHGSLLIETNGDPAPAIAALHAISLRLLAGFPPGRVSFVFIDPVGLGRGFAGLMHLSDYEETLITRRIWTQAAQIEERLADLGDHIEKMIQMYLRNEYATIADYNEKAGSVAEKYRFLVIAGFPAAFSETAAKRLRSIAASGARCGVHLLIQSDASQPPPDAALQEELHRACLRVKLDHGIFHLAGSSLDRCPLTFDAAPPEEDASVLVHRIGKASVDSNRVQVPFADIAPAPEERWTLDTSEELRVPIGRAGATKLQMLAIGKGTRQHMLVAGKTGSGKSTLFHVIITNLALWCSPEQVEFYLVDFKKGVEFKCYATHRLPHARVVAIESDREFALSVLQQVDAELKRRGELFRKAGSQDLASYNRGGDPLPRTLLMIDEFQEFFTEDDPVAQQASLLLDRIVRQGRAFGIHVILGSQTLGGAYTLARATLGQMAVRVALQCNEADAHLIMDEENPAPRLLTRPGEGIYNDQAGAMAANSPFQIVWLPEQERDAALDEVTRLATTAGEFPPVPVVFEGNAPADLDENRELAAALRTKPVTRPTSARAWLGAPNAIKGPTEAIFQRQSGSHLLAVGQSSERTFSLLSVAILSLASQYAAGDAEFIILDPYPEGAPEGSFKNLAEMLPHRTRIGGPSETAALLADLGATLAARHGGAGAGDPEIFLIVRDLQRFKALKPEDEFKFSMDDSPAASPSQVLADVLNEGGTAGIHVLASTDTWNNVSRWIPRKLLAEFEMRVLFQMSANDSSSLIDSPAASNLGLHRALFHNEHFGSAETFRPYALPDSGWLAAAATLLKGG